MERDWPPKVKSLAQGHSWSVAEEPDCATFCSDRGQTQLQVEREGDSEKEEGLGWSGAVVGKSRVQGTLAAKGPGCPMLGRCAWLAMWPKSSRCSSLSLR